MIDQGRDKDFSEIKFSRGENSVPVFVVNTVSQQEYYLLIHVQEIAPRW